MVAGKFSARNSQFLADGLIETVHLCSQVFLDRLQNQEQIQALLNEVFGSKRRISLDEFKRINQEVTSEMFLSLIILLQNSLPCTENFYRYQKNFEKYISTEGADAEKVRPGLDGQVRTIASPRVMSNSPLASLAKQHGINFNPSGTKNMLSFAANKGGAAAGAEESKGEEGVVGVQLRTAKQIQAEKKAR